MATCDQSLSQTAQRTRAPPGRRFPLQTLAKCAKMLPVMLWGAAILRKSYKLQASGVSETEIFLCAHHITSPVPADRQAQKLHRLAAPSHVLIGPDAVHCCRTMPQPRRSRWAARCSRSLVAFPPRCHTNMWTSTAFCRSSAICCIHENMAVSSLETRHHEPLCAGNGEAQRAAHDGRRCRPDADLPRL